jgi:hypothetical protein
MWAPDWRGTINVKQKMIKLGGRFIGTLCSALATSLEV